MCQSFYVERKSMCIDLFMLNLCTSIFLQSTRNVEIESMCIECVHQIYRYDSDLSRFLGCKMTMGEIVFMLKW